MSDDTKKAVVLAALEPLIHEAEEKGLWLVALYDNGIWFNPAELRLANEEGKFVWGPDNFELRDPYERYTQLVNIANEARKAAESFKRRAHL